METAERPLNILFVSATVPYPAIDGGRIRVLSLIGHLCKVHKVTFLTSVASPADEQGVQYLCEIGMEVVDVKVDRGTCFRNFMRSLIHRKPFTVAKYYSADMAKALDSLLRSRKFDVVHFEMLHTGQFLSVLNRVDKALNLKTRTVLGEQNIDSSIWQRLVNVEPNPLKKMIFWLQYKSFANYENRMCRRFDVCVCVSEEDMNRLRELCPGVRAEIVPNGVDPDYFSPQESEDEAQLVFTGSMDWQPNEDAVVYFCEHVFPHIKAEFPSATFYIVGSNPTDRVLELRKVQGVVVTGLVEDVRPYIAGSAVYVVPLRIGGGTRLKILQALAMKKAVVSTSIGCEGLDVRENEHLFVADDPKRFAEEVVRLMKDSSLRRKLGENGRALVMERYDWKAIAEKLGSIYKGLLDQ